MFCTYCGSPIASEQSVCANCGRSSTGARVASAERARVAEHVHLLAILWFVIGAFWLIPAVIMAVLATFITVPLVAEGRLPNTRLAHGELISRIEPPVNPV